MFTLTLTARTVIYIPNFIVLRKKQILNGTQGLCVVCVNNLKTLRNIK